MRLNIATIRIYWGIIIFIRRIQVKRIFLSFDISFVWFSWVFFNIFEKWHWSCKILKIETGILLLKYLLIVRYIIIYGIGNWYRSTLTYWSFQCTATTAAAFASTAFTGFWRTIVQMAVTDISFNKFSDNLKSYDIITIQRFIIILKEWSMYFTWRGVLWCLSLTWDSDLEVFGTWSWFLVTVSLLAFLAKLLVKLLFVILFLLFFCDLYCLSSLILSFFE